MTLSKDKKANNQIIPNENWNKSPICTANIVWIYINKTSMIDRSYHESNLENTVWFYNSPNPHYETKHI